MGRHGPAIAKPRPIFLAGPPVGANWEMTVSASVPPLVDAPPCSGRHRPFAIAGAWHRLPLLVRAPHRRLRFESQLAPDKTILAVADPLPPLEAAVEISFRVIDDKALSSW